MAAVDRIRIRELWFAHVRGGSVRELDPGADRVLTAGRDAGTALNAAVSAVLAEELDDPPLRAARDRAATDLRAAAVNAIRRFRALVALQATDPVTGDIVDQAAFDDAESLADTYLPNGNLGGLAPEGPALQLQAGLIRDALAARPECAPLAQTLTGLVDAHRAAMDQVAREADELKSVRKKLEAARSRADDLRKAGWHYLNYLALMTRIEIDIRAIYPVAARAGSDDPTAADATLDSVGAPTPESASEPTEEAPLGG